MWETVKLGDLFKIGSSKRVLKADWKDSGVPFYRGREITSLSKAGNVENDLFITEEHFLELKSNYGVPQKGDLMVTAIGTIGNTYIVSEQDKFYFKDASVLWLRKNSDINIRFVDYWFKSSSFFKQLEFGNGATVDTLSISKLNVMDFPLPPLAEQQRIVAKLDAAFAEIDGAIEDVEKQAIEVINCGYKAMRNILDELGNEFSKKSLNEVVTIQPKKILALEQIGETDEVSFMGMNKLGIEKKYSEPSETKPLKEVFKSYQYFEENDVVFAKITPCFENGKLGIMRNLANGIGFGSSEFVVLRSKSETHSDFVYYCLLDNVFRKNGAENMSGAVGHKRVTKEYYFNYKIPVPPLDIQDLFVKKFDEIWTHASTIAKVKHKKKAELTALKSAILANELQSEAA